ncbi:hypothetical protein ACWFNE_03195 [Cellulomonas sp. NPDC055163]
MTFAIRRPNLDSVDTEKLKLQAAEKAAVLAAAAKVQAAEAAGQAAGAAAHAKEWGTPKAEAAIEWLVPRVEHLYKESLKAAVPRVERAAGAASPAIDSAHDKLVDELIPSVVAAVNAAAVKAGAIADKAAEATAPQKSHRGAKTFWILAGIAGAAAAFAAWTRSRAQTDPWAEPWEPTSADTSSNGLRTRAHDAREDLTDRVGGAAEAVGEAAGVTVAKSREAAQRAAEKVTEAREDLTEKVSEATKKATTRRSASKRPDSAAGDADESLPDTSAVAPIVPVAGGAPDPVVETAPERTTDEDRTDRGTL